MGKNKRHYYDHNFNASEEVALESRDPLPN